MYPDSGLKLIQLLENQYQKRSKSSKYDRLFKSGTLVLTWRTKVGSSLHPDGETLVPAGEPWGRWTTAHKNNESNELPLYGYIPGSSIRGVVRAWAKNKPDIYPRMVDLLGTQTNSAIQSGKIEFLDAFPTQPTRLSLDIANPQEHFQVYHQNTDNSGVASPNPCLMYSLGNGLKPIQFKLAIRGKSNVGVTPQDIDEVWSWIQEALSVYGLGSRTASGYGQIISKKKISGLTTEYFHTQEFGFSLFSQGCSGPDQRRGSVELRPSHWRGWLRSWTLRFLLGVMSEENADLTLKELFGTLNQKGCVRLKMLPRPNQDLLAEVSEGQEGEPSFYAWKGILELSGSEEVLSILLPIIKFAVSVGGLGRGYRRPLHQFSREVIDRKTGERRAISLSRGSYLNLLYQPEGRDKAVNFALPPHRVNAWQNCYSQWQKKVLAVYQSRVTPIEQGLQLENQALRAEVFSPETCSIYLVNGPNQLPIDQKNMRWTTRDTMATRGNGMQLIYQERYKRNPEIGGNATDGQSHCSWASIRQRPVQNEGIKEIVCLFMGGQTPGNGHLRSRFLTDLSNIPGNTHLFGVQPERN